MNWTYNLNSYIISMRTYKQWLLIKVIPMPLYIPSLFCSTVKYIMRFFKLKKTHIPFKVLPCLNCSIDNDGDGIIDEDCIEETSKLIFIH